MYAVRDAMRNLGKKKSKNQKSSWLRKDSPIRKKSVKSVITHAHMAFRLRCPRFIKSLHWEWKYGVFGMHLRNGIRTSFTSTFRNGFPCHFGKINQFPQFFVMHWIVVPIQCSRSRFNATTSIDISLCSLLNYRYCPATMIMTIASSN